ncbi:MAG: class I SAM-dependent methyltransferase [Endomicrobiales bacterium]|nr:class I SAM-dependent methyltransferase [Endomicrobiales bacterium]
MKREEAVYREIWDKKAGLPEGVNSRAAGILRHLDPGDRLLDVGAGRGETALVAKGIFREIHAIDISEKALETARQRGAVTKKVNLNSEKIPYQDGFFDAAVCLDAIEHVIDPIELVREIRRVLKDNGSLVLSTPNFRKVKNILRLLFKGSFPKTSGDRVGWDGGHLHYFTYKDLKDILEDNGFAVARRDCLVSEEKFSSFKKLLELLLPKTVFEEFIAGGIVIKAIKNK